MLLRQPHGNILACLKVLDVCSRLLDVHHRHTFWHTHAWPAGQHSKHPNQDIYLRFAADLQLPTNAQRFRVRLFRELYRYLWLGCTALDALGLV